MTRLFFALVLCGLLPLIRAQASINFTGKIPNADAFTRGNSGINCQYLGNAECAASGTPRNRFGQAFLEAGEKWTAALCKADSDGDGLSNGQELGDPCCKWTPDNPTVGRTGGLSHPGLFSSKNNVPMPECPSPSPSPSVSAVPSPSASVSPSMSAGASPSASPVPPSPSASAAAGTGATPVAAPGAPRETPPPADSAVTPEPSPEASAEVSGESGATATASPEDDDGSVCFPAHATVTLEDGSSVAMRDLRVGDRVQVGAGRFSDVFMFSHKLADVKYRFVTLKAAAGARSVSLSLTQGHYVYANGKAMPAGAVRVGDSLELPGAPECARVTEVKSETLTGLYNPQTVDGDIVVNGVRASTFTHAVKHVTAHCMMMPVRAVFRYFGVHLTALEGGADRIADMLPSQV